MAETLSQTPPALHGPSEKERKYDRQLRLWAATGQSALESSNILLVNASCGAVGVESLKNLVLPGIGRFTIADETIVSDEDLGINFFVDESCLGKSRAQCCANLLIDLNPEVQGQWWPREEGPSSFDQFLEESDSDPFSIILVTMPLESARLQLIKGYSEKHGVPLVVARSAGFFSYFSIQLPGTFPVVDTHPDESATADLRLLAPWPELTSFSVNMAKDLDNMDDHEHGHVPLVIILLHYLEQWKREHDGAYPGSYNDKVAFRELISNAMRQSNPEGGEENFEEAAAAVMKHIVKPTLPGNLKEVFDYKHDDSESKSSFWIIANATKKFYQDHGVLPVAGGLPDMKAQSNVYIQLQNLYKDKARRDAKEVLTTARSTPGGESVDAEEVELFCTNARFIKLIKAPSETDKSLAQITDQELANDEVAELSGQAIPYSLIPIYLALTGLPDASSTATAAQIIESITQRAPAAAGKARITTIAEEVARTQGNELHNISAVVGGMVAQEMIKIITKQYIPIDNTCIYDGIDSRCQVLRL